MHVVITALSWSRRRHVGSSHLPFPYVSRTSHASMAAVVQRKNMSDDDASSVFVAHVPVGRCKPGQLWILPKLTQQGLTSKWGEVSKHYNIISEFIDKTNGHVPLQTPLTRQFASVLKKSELNWSLGDIEKSTYHLRSMLKRLKIKNESSSTES